MSTNVKELVRRFRDELWNEGNLKVADEIIAPNCLYHIYDPITPFAGTGPERAMKSVVMFRAAFPDLQMTIEDLFAEGDRAMARWTCRGTHTGDLLGVSPSRMQVTVAGMDMYRVADGKIQEFWINWDAMGLMQQIGLEPVANEASA
ncbi:MAG: ester cyclase [Acidimicrobiia bacterium]|nr:ester cyclase [Acidimicrobiia bacterium]